MLADEAEMAEAKPIIELEERLERGDTHCFVAIAQRAESMPEEQRGASVAGERQVAREAWLLNTKPAPLK